MSNMAPTALMQAVARCDIKRVRELARRGRVNCQATALHVTALHIASATYAHYFRFGHHVKATDANSIIEVLLSRGADPLIENARYENASVAGDGSTAPALRNWFRQMAEQQAEVSNFDDDKPWQFKITGASFDGRASQKDWPEDDERHWSESAVAA